MFVCIFMLVIVLSLVLVSLIVLVFTLLFLYFFCDFSSSLSVFFRLSVCSEYVPRWLQEQLLRIKYDMIQLLSFLK